jgi:arylsulfatase A-like enzyme
MKPPLALLILSSFCIPHFSFAAEQRPNILIFLADDLGYADIGVNGCMDIPTPNIDSIAKNGVRFTDGYAAHPVCSPSRAALMSGMYQHRFGFEHNSGPERYASPEFGQPRSVPTLAEKLKGAGYATGMMGKWHIGFKEGLRPHERGFDEHFGFLSGARSYYPDNPRENDPLIRNGVPVQGEKDYLTDAFAREAASFIERSKDKPWFVYFAFNAVHSPLEATAAYEARFPHITDKKRKTYAGMLSALDDAIGRVMTKVRELGQEENTLVMFYSDNGGPTGETSSRNDPLRGFKGQMFEGGIRVPFAMQWKGTVPAGQTYREMVMGFDYHATALAAAGVSVPKDKPLDGVNLIPFVTGKETGRPHEQLFWRAGPSHAARVGDWKLVTSPQQGGTMLFNLRDDIGEQNNLAASQPAKLKELQAAFAEWEKGTQPAKWVRQDQRNAEPGGKPKSGAPAASRRGTSRVDDAFKAADKNNDGKLTREEYPQKDVFDAVDANKDGAATLEEVRAYYQQRRGTPK